MLFQAGGKLYYDELDFATLSLLFVQLFCSRHLTCTYLLLHVI